MFVITVAAGTARAGRFVLCVIVRGVVGRFARRGEFGRFPRFAVSAVGLLIRRSGVFVRGVSRNYLVEQGPRQGWLMDWRPISWRCRDFAGAL